MPNKNSHADHIPLRTCVVCKKKVDSTELLNFFSLGVALVFDLHGKLPYRKYYVCPTEECKMMLDKWFKRYQKRFQSSRKSSVPHVVSAAQKSQNDKTIREHKHNG